MMAGANIISQEKNPFLKREEFVVKIESNGSPTEDVAKDAIGKDKDLTVIKKINSNFGRNSFVIEAVVYDSAEDKEKVETIPQKVRKKMDAEKAAEAANAEKAKAEEEAKTEEKVEEAPVEEIAPEAKSEEVKAPEGVPSEEGK